MPYLKAPNYYHLDDWPKSTSPKFFTTKIWHQFLLFCLTWLSAVKSVCVTHLVVCRINRWQAFLHPLFFSSVSFLISSVPIQLLSAPPHLCSTHFLSFSFPSLFLLLPSHGSSPSVCPAPAFSTVCILMSLNQSICLFISSWVIWAAHSHFVEERTADESAAMVSSR